MALVFATMCITIVLWQTRLPLPRAAGLFAILAVALAVGITNAYRRQKRVIESFRLTLAPDRIVLVREGLPDLSITRDEVTRIQEVARKRVELFTADRLRSLAVPAFVEGYDDLVSRPAEWKPIERVEGKTPWLIIHLLVMAGVGAGLLACFYSSDPRIVLPIGIVLVVVIVYGLYEVRHSPHVDERTRKGAYVGLFPAVFLVVRMVMVLF